MTEAAVQRDIPEPTVLHWPAPGGEVRVLSFVSKADAGAYVADVIADTLQAAVADRGKALWIGCGGSTPKPIYESLTTLDLDWDRITLAQVDERFVPTDDTNSNTRMMREALEPVLDDMDFMTLIQDLSSAQACADKAEARFLELGGGAAPVFDIALMGMGPDAHYASIFPHHAINGEVYGTDRIVLPVAPTDGSLEPVLPRITLSVPALNRSRKIIFFITGATKLEVLRSASQSTDPLESPIGAFLAQCPAPVEFVWAA
ncbi:6-phosphogluconolactonase [Asticcacaulis biprosthecium C19]|uniref:6-phosphogluconolactonase n=1 Tax=Asticcacaulis biprosthecium C19 TaxID=715226 RepID=F4QPL2_9CAUL|nr:6-phosphogluconolactonase [Asticcacaulis biprosthecium]EGF91270.1 6-phosphogluconolactonase [Asticcacaulis biprosthecium C19]